MNATLLMNRRKKKPLENIVLPPDSWIMLSGLKNQKLPPVFSILVGAKLVVAVMVSGCTTPSETFDCPAGKGIGCQSISQVNTMVNQGLLGKETSSGEGRNLVEEGQQPGTPSSPVTIPTGFSSLEPIKAVPDSPILPRLQIPVSESLAVQRIPEHYARVWLAPFQDGQGNFHEASVVYTVLKAGQWRLATPSSPPGIPLNKTEGNTDRQPIDDTPLKEVH